MYVITIHKGDLLFRVSLQIEGDSLSEYHLDWEEIFNITFSIDIDIITIPYRLISLHTSFIRNVFSTIDSILNICVSIVIHPHTERSALRCQGLIVHINYPITVIIGNKFCIKTVNINLFPRSREGFSIRDCCRTNKAIFVFHQNILPFRKFHGKCVVSIWCFLI